MVKEAPIPKVARKSYCVPDSFELVLKARKGKRKRKPALEHVRYLPVLGPVLAGYPGPSPVDEVLDGYFPIPVSQVPDPDAFVLRVTSDSMTGFVEEDGFIVVSPVYRSKLKPDDLVVVRIEPGDTLVKRHIKTDQ